MSAAEKIRGVWGGMAEPCRCRGEKGELSSGGGGAGGTAELPQLRSFFLGIHQLWHTPRAGVPFFVI